MYPVLWAYQVGGNPPANAGGVGLIPGSGRSADYSPAKRESRKMMGRIAS